MQSPSIDVPLGDAAEEVLESMFFLSALERGQPPLGETQDWMGAELDFGGKVAGTFGVLLSPQLARTVAANFLGEEDGELERRQVDEVIGELANMICGNALNRSDCAAVFDLSSPQPSTRTGPAEGAEFEWLVFEEGWLCPWIRQEPQ